MYYLYFFSIVFHDFLAVIYLFIFYLLFIDVNSNVAKQLSKNSYMLFNHLQDRI